MYITRVQPQSLLSTFFLQPTTALKKINPLFGGGDYSKELEKITTLLVISYVALGPPPLPPPLHP
jgi:hypothetical protein